MLTEYLIAEIGSTTTVVTAIKENPHGIAIIGQGKSSTTVSEGDVNIGLNKAIEDLEKAVGEKLVYDKLLASSSAAGGLRISVHGLVEEMTVKAAKEAALGAGGNIKYITAGKLKERDLIKLRKISPNLIIISGGTEFGESETALYNSQLLKDQHLNIPIIYCGNSAIQDEIAEIFTGDELYIVPNVYPRVDELNVEPTRRIIQRAFENNIVKAPGMQKIREMVQGRILPTPGAVMEAAELIYSILGDVMVVDVGGATTDVHSVTVGDKKIQDILISPEPKAKRTVEGDLGVYINADNLIDLLEDYELPALNRQEISGLVKSIPESQREKEISNLLAKKAVEVAINRHAGYLKRVYGTTKAYAAFGKDLSMVKFIIGTGGSLVKLGKGEEILANVKYLKEDLTMLPRKEAKILIDKNYIMACAGVLMQENKEAAIQLLTNSFEIGEINN